MSLMPKELLLLVKLTGIEEVADKAEAQKFLDSQAEIGRRIGLLLRRFGVRATKVEVAIGPHPDMDINSFLHALQYELEALVVAWRRKAETSKTCGALSAVGALLAQGLGFLQGAVTTREVHDALCEAPARGLGSRPADPGVSVVPFERSLYEAMPIELLRSLVAMRIGPEAERLDREALLGMLFPPDPPAN